MADLDLSRVSREALEALAIAALDSPEIELELARIRAEATADSACEKCKGTRRVQCECGCGPMSCGCDQPPPRTRAEVRQLEIACATDFCNRLNAAMQDSDEWGTWADMLRSLKEQGLSVTVACPSPAPAPTTEHERAVLVACKALSTESLESFGKPASTPWVKFAHAELARRAAEREEKQ